MACVRIHLKCSFVVIDRVKWNSFAEMPLIFPGHTTRTPCPKSTPSTTKLCLRLTKSISKHKKPYEGVKLAKLSFIFNWHTTFPSRFCKCVLSSINFGAVVFVMFFSLCFFSFTVLLQQLCCLLMKFVQPFLGDWAKPRCDASFKWLHRNMNITVRIKHAYIITLREREHFWKQFTIFGTNKLLWDLYLSLCKIVANRIWTLNSLIDCSKAAKKGRELVCNLHVETQRRLVRRKSTQQLFSVCAQRCLGSREESTCTRCTAHGCLFSYVFDKSVASAWMRNGGLLLRFALRLLCVLFFFLFVLDKFTGSAYKSKRTTNF